MKTEDQDKGHLTTKIKALQQEAMAQGVVLLCATSDGAVAPSVDAAWVEKANGFVDAAIHTAKCSHAVRNRTDRENIEPIFAAEKAALAALRAHLSTALPAQPKE